MGRSDITSASGNISIIGNAGGCGTAGVNTGVYIQPFASGSCITSTSGNISIIGNAGGGSGQYNYGFDEQSGCISTVEQFRL